MLFQALFLCLKLHTPYSEMTIEYWTRTEVFSPLVHRPLYQALEKIPNGFISQKVFIKWFCKSLFPHKSVSLSFIITNTKNTLMNLCGNRLLQDDFINTSCEIRWTTTLSSKVNSPSHNSL